MRMSLKWIVTSIFTLAFLFPFSSFSNAQDTASVGQPTSNHFSSTSQLEPASLAGEYDQLEHRASAGDKIAAVKLSEDIRYCEHVRTIQERIKFWREYRSTQDRDPKATHDELPPNFSKEKMDALNRDINGFCAGYDGSMRDGRAYVVMLQAAKLGDWDSAACYVATEYPFIKGKYKETDWSTYRSNALNLLDAAIHHGQWNVVRAAMTAMSIMWIDNAPPSAALDGDVPMNYRLHRLIQLGALPGSAETDFLQRGIDKESKETTLEQQLAGDQWAAEIYTRYFNQSGPSTPFVTACTHEPMQFTILKQ
jgi:hypothetical protein